MKAIKYIGITLAGISVVAVLLYVTGYGGQLLFQGFTAYHKPAGEFDPKLAAPAPDYQLDENWAALPAMDDPADMVPAGIPDMAAMQLPIDVFFIHPTGYLTTASWTSSMDVDSGTEENTQWMMANQASAFNGCCEIYAPRYREANIFAYFGDAEVRDEVLGFAYEDVARAFRSYLENHNQGRPFIVAGHSQGSHHAKRLIAEEIDDQPIADKLVAAYLIGATLIPISPEWFASLKDVTPCTSATDLQCVVHWDTMPPDAEPMEREASSLCTNPLSWRNDEVLVAAEFHEGALVPVGEYNGAFGKQPDQATGQGFSPMEPPVIGLTNAQCREGSLFVEDQSEGPMAKMAAVMPGSYHGLDYNLFYMNIRNNAILRANTYLASAKPEQGEP